MARLARRNETTCSCLAYKFPHREGGGECGRLAQEREDDHGECGSCGGSGGGGDAALRCYSCSGSGSRYGYGRSVRSDDYDDEPYYDDPRADYF